MRTLTPILRDVLILALVFWAGLYVVSAFWPKSSLAQHATVAVNGHEYTVELAWTRKQHANGLMHRRALREGHGMLFLYHRPQPLRFWMKDTYVPLDIIYVAADRHVAQIYSQALPCRASPCPAYPSAAAAQYVLELPAGTCVGDGLAVGDKLTMIRKW